MIPISQAAQEFLACRRIAITGVSRTPGSHGSNVVYDRLVERGYEVFPVNPNATQIGEQPCYPTVAAIPDGVDAIVIGTAPSRALDTMKEAVALGVRHVWMHRSMDAGSVSDDATAYGRARRPSHRRRLSADVRPRRRRHPQVHVRAAQATREGAAQSRVTASVRQAAIAGRTRGGWAYDSAPRALRLAAPSPADATWSAPARCSRWALRGR